MFVGWAGGEMGGGCVEGGREGWWVTVRGPSGETRHAQVCFLCAEVGVVQGGGAGPEFEARLSCRSQVDKSLLFI